MLLSILCSLPIIISLLVIRRFVRQWWRTRCLDNIPGPPSSSSWAGVLYQLFDPISGWKFCEDISKSYGGVVRIRGVLGENQLYVFDPRALQDIFGKNQHIFDENDAFYEGNKMFFGDGILSTMGPHHTRHRKMLNPVFSVSNIREMTSTFYEVSYKLRDALSMKVENGPQEIDVLDWMTRVALELISQSGLGYSFDSLNEDGIPHPYTSSAKQLISLSSTDMVLRSVLMPVVVRLGYRFPRISNFLINNAPSKLIRQLKGIIDVLHNTSVEIIESKKKALEDGDVHVADQIGHGKDLISILMKSNLDASAADRLSDIELVGQVTSFTFAATDTTSGAMGRILHQLCLHQEVQQKLREEIQSSRQKHGDLDYDQLQSLPYLDAVCRETLRLYPPMSHVIRTVRQDVILPLQNPIRGVNGDDMHEVFIPEGTDINVSFISSNRNPEVWGPDADEWKPERWLQPLPSTLADAHVPGIYSQIMTFSGGSRACIGFKFSQLEMKVVLSLLLESFHFSPSKREIFWQMRILNSPNVDPKGTCPTLPMIVRLVNA